jgi:hypothetical protein
MQIKLNPYPVTVDVVFTKQDFTKRYKKVRGYSPDLDGCTGMMACLADDFLLVGVFNSSTTTLVHELNHALIHTMEYIGLSIVSQTSEAYCYLMDSVLKQTLPKLK